MSALLWINEVQNFSSTPTSPSEGWVAKNWQKDDLGHVFFEAQSKDLPQACAINKDNFVLFPQVNYGSHEIYLDDDLTIRQGFPNFTPSNFIFSSPAVECAVLSHAKEVKWRVYPYSKYFAKIDSWPRIVTSEKVILAKFFGQYSFLIGASGLFILLILALNILSGREPIHKILAFCGIIVSAIIYNITSVGPIFGLPWSTLTSHRIGDSSISLSVLLLCFIFLWDKIVPAWSAYLTLSAFLTASIFWIFGENGDIVQFGSNLMYLPCLITFFIGTWNLFKKAIRAKAVEAYLRLLCSILFLLTIIIDALVNINRIDYTVISFGTLAGLMIQLIATKRKIDSTYRERDYLKRNLEAEVEKRSEELKKLYLKLENANAELIRSAKFASLGMLSAGIVHEINNSTNYINGALSPLEKAIDKLKPDSEDNYQNSKFLIDTIREGANQITEIMKALNQFSGLNQAKLKEIRILDSVQTVKTILGPKLKERHYIETDIQNDFSIISDVAMFNQILINLVDNAIDASPNGGKITIKAYGFNSKKVIEVSDNGHGIEMEVQAKIFDPFFSTKERSRGLGLYMVSHEVRQLNGEITFKSKPGEGTIFYLMFKQLESFT